MLALLELAPGFVPAPRFDETAQRLRIPLRLAGGGRATIDLVHRADRAALIDTLEAWPSWEELPHRVLARVSPARGGFLARPLSLLIGDASYAVALGEEPPVGMTRRASSPSLPAPSGTAKAESSTTTAECIEP